MLTSVYRMRIAMFILQLCVLGFDLIPFMRKLLVVFSILFVLVFLMYPLYMLLRYYGTNVTMAQIVNVLPKGPAPYESGGVLYGANPEREFVGDPRSSSSYGVFEKPIAQTAAAFRPGVKCQTGATMDQIVTLLQQGSPVVAWYTTNPTTGITYRREWIDYQTGETVRWPSGEHAVVICGTDGDMLTYRDPNTGGSVTMLKSEFLKVFNVLGARIVYYPN